MFDKFIRELDWFPSTMTISISLPVDEKGYLDRRCPHQECGVFFKALSADWEDHISDDAACCTKCGAKDDPDEFHTTSAMGLCGTACEGVR